MKRNILIPTDFSDNAWNALNYAVHLYKDEACSFYIMNAFQVFDFPSEILLPMNPVEERFRIAREHSERNLQKILDGLEVRSDNPHHEFHTISIYNRLLAAVREVLAEKQIDLIVMGTRGEGGHTIKEFGSNAVEVMENIRQCPILAIPKKASVYLKGGKKEIVFSTNFRTPYSREDLAFLLRAAELYKAEIRVLHIQEGGGLTEEQQRNRELLEENLKEVRHGFHILTHVKVAPGIHSFVESRGSDLLAMIYKKPGFFGSIFSAPMVEKMNERQGVPLLVLPL